MSYSAPLDEMIFTLRAVADCARLTALPEFAMLDVSEEALVELLQPAAQLAERSVAPSNRSGDRQGAALVDGRVELAPAVTRALCDVLQGGWNGATMPNDVGGFGLPESVGTAVMEMWNSANMAMALNPMLTIGAAMALLAHASSEQIERYVPKMISGEWSGTMNLTEPAAGSDLGRISMQAERCGDFYRLRGQKIFITWGEHEATSNIVHLVLARTPDAPPGTRGISLFIVPKFLVNADGSLGDRNDVQCVSLEHKLGIHSSPTCVMSFGDRDGAVGYLVGSENQGLAYLFTMMNEARLKVGLQGLAIAEGAHQQALTYARERVQGSDAQGCPAPIVRHADVQRMLLTQRALIQAMRALAYTEAVYVDFARHAQDTEARAGAQRRVDLMVPIVKGWLTELGQEVANLGIQIHGGMGFIEETGAAQWLRDVRIAAIYEGTNGIQALDLLGRKVLRDEARALSEWLAQMTECDQAIASVQPALQREVELFRASRNELAVSCQHLLARGRVDSDGTKAGAFDFMMQCGYVYGAWQSLRILALLADDGGERARARCAAARFYLDRILPRAAQHAQSLRADTSYWGEAGLLA